MGDCTVTGDASGPPCFFSGFCLFLFSLALVYGSVSSKYNMLVCVVSLLCAHCGMTWTDTTCRGACLISTYFYLLQFVYVLVFTTLVTVWCLQIVFRHICGNQMGRFNQTTLPPPHTHVGRMPVTAEPLEGERSVDETWDQRGWSASLCLLIALIYFLPPVDS